MTSSAQTRESLGTVLVLGATGIIGRELVGAAIGRGFDVVAISRRPQASSDLRIRYVAVDGYDTPALCTALEGLRFVAVIDLLSFTASQLEASLYGLAGLLDQYIFFSSATVYASAGAERPITEDWPRVQEGWAYPLKKIECEHRLRDLCAKLGIVYTIVRPYITYSDQRIPFGPWESETVLARLAERRPIIIGDEIARARTSLTDSRDLARATLQLVSNPAAINEDFHIASPETQTWSDVYAVAGQIMGVVPWIISIPTAKVLDVFPDLSGKISDRLLNRSFDNSKLLSACPGFTFEHSLRDGFTAAIAGYQALGVRRNAPGYVGYMDRVIVSSSADAAIRKERRRYARGELRRSLGDFLRYEVSYRRWLLKGLRRVRGTSRKTEKLESNYA